MVNLCVLIAYIPWRRYSQSQNDNEFFVLKQINNKDSTEPLYETCESTIVKDIKQKISTIPVHQPEIRKEKTKEGQVLDSYIEPVKNNCIKKFSNSYSKAIVVGSILHGVVRGVIDGNSFYFYQTDFSPHQIALEESSKNYETTATGNLQQYKASKYYKDSSCSREFIKIKIDGINTPNACDLAHFPSTISSPDFIVFSTKNFLKQLIENTIVTIKIIEIENSSCYICDVFMYYFHDYKITKKIAKDKYVDPNGNLLVFYDLIKPEYAKFAFIDDIFFAKQDNVAEIMLYFGQALFNRNTLFHNRNLYENYNMLETTAKSKGRGIFQLISDPIVSFSDKSMSYESLSQKSKITTYTRQNAE